MQVIKKLNKEKSFHKIILNTIKLIVYTIFLIFPFLDKYINHTFSQILWYPCCLFSTIFIFIDYRKKEKTFKNPLYEFLGKWGFINIVPVLLSIFVFRYYNIYNIWKWILFTYTLVYLVLISIFLYLFKLKNNYISKEKQKFEFFSAVNNLFFFLCIDIFFFAVHINHTKTIFIIGILSVILLFSGLASAFINLNMNYITLLLEISELIIGLGISVYLIYIINDINLRNIILTISATVFSGIFTLVGVAWTFKKSEENRKKDIQRIENENKEQERKKLIPYICLNNSNHYDVCAKISIKSRNNLQCPHNDISEKETNQLFKIQDFYLKNVSESNILIEGIYINDKYCPFEDTLLEKNAICKIVTTQNNLILSSEISSIELIVKDILENTYILTCKFDYEIQERTRYQYTDKNNNIVTFYPYEYSIKSISLPKLSSIS